MHRLCLEESCISRTCTSYKWRFCPLSCPLSHHSAHIIKAACTEAPTGDNADEHAGTTATEAPIDHVNDVVEATTGSGDNARHNQCGKSETFNPFPARESFKRLSHMAISIFKQKCFAGKGLIGVPVLFTWCHSWLSKECHIFWTYYILVCSKPFWI